MNKTILQAKRKLKIPYHNFQGFLAANHYDYPASAMTVIGVTGTNGKTSTCFMIYNTLLKAGYPVAMMTTVSTSIMGQDDEQTGHMTTPGPRILNKRIAAMRDAGVKFLVLEVSSHALTQGRVFGVPIDIAVLTNVTREHLDYHRTFSNYRGAKLKLFKMLKNNAKHGGRGIGIINADDPSLRLFSKYTPHPVSYGIDHGDVRASEIDLTTKGSSYQATIEDRTYKLKVNIAGECYIYNSLAAATVCHYLGLSKKEIEQGISSLKGVSGRMSPVETKADFNIIVDYAHTPDAYKKTIPSIKEATKGRLFVICGAAGNRDNDKFDEMGQIAGNHADLVIITEEDAGNQDVRKLSELVAEGVRKAGKKEGDGLEIINDREQAIEFAIKQAKKDDTILLLGMGHQKVIERAHGQDEWNDSDKARELVAKHLAGKKKVKKSPK